MKVVPFLLFFQFFAASCADETAGGGVPFEKLYPDGAIMEAGFLLEGQVRTGLWVSYFPNASKETEGHYVDGLKSGEWLYWYENGQLEQKTEYLEGRMDGRNTVWYRNGQMEADGVVKAGKLNGLSTGWYESGQKKFEIRSIEDIPNGESLVWNENGYLNFSKSGIYESGVRVSGIQGHERMQEEQWEIQTAGTLFEGLDLDDFSRVETVMGFTGRWNEVSAPMVIQYLDPEVSAEQWVKDASPVLAELREILAQMKSELILFPKSSFRDSYLAELLRTQGEKLDAMTQIHKAVSQGDQEAELLAQEVIQGIADEQKELILGFFDQMREAGLMTSEVEQVIKDRSQKNAALLNPQGGG